MSHRTASLLFVVVTVGIASSISLIGGIGIEVVQEELLKLAPLLIALPALNSMVGDFATLIAAHAGDPAERTRSHSELIRAILPAVIMNIVFITGVSLFLGIQRDYDVTNVFLMKFAGFITFSIAIVLSAMLFITFLLDSILRKHRLNPDDVLIPVVTSVSDIFMLGLIALAAWRLF